jgi:hypothetical protein
VWWTTVRAWRSVLDDIDVENEIASALFLGPEVDEAAPAIADSQGD